MNKIVKKGFVSLELIILTSIIIFFGVIAFMYFTKDSREILDVSKNGMHGSIDVFDVETKTRK